LNELLIAGKYAVYKKDDDDNTENINNDKEENKYNNNDWSNTILPTPTNDDANK
jgi:hypothetical protein